MGLFTVSGAGRLGPRVSGGGTTDCETSDEIDDGSWRWTLFVTFGRTMNTLAGRCNDQGRSRSSLGTFPVMKM